MSSRLTETFLSLFLTVLLLMALEVICTALIPAFGFYHFLLPFNVLFILFLAFRVNSPFLPVFILIIQIFHSVFSVESLAHGTLSGITICLFISYVKSIIEFTTVISTIVITFMAMIVWYVITSVFLYISLGDLDFILNRFWSSLPEYFVISLISPFFFGILGRIWKLNVMKTVDV